MIRPVALVGALLFSVAFAACDNASPTTPSTVTETFSGTLEVKGQRFHTLTTGTDASATITLVELNPSVVVGVGVGSQSGGNCVIAAADDSVARGEALQIGLPTGTYCVQIYDVGNATVPLAYTLTGEPPMIEGASGQQGTGKKTGAPRVNTVGGARTMWCGSRAPGRP